MAEQKKGLARRAFLIGGAALTGGAVIGLGLLSRVDLDGLDGAVGADGSIRLNAWIHMLSDGRVRFAIPRTEMGQGVFTGLPMLLAEEMELPLDPATVEVVHPVEALPVYANFTLGLQSRPEDQTGPLAWTGRRVMALLPYIGTGGSSSVVDAWTHYRRAGASARSMLIRAAAAGWQVPAAECRAEAGRVLHPPSGRSATFGELATAAAAQTPDPQVPLKSPDAFRLIGTTAPRLDIPAKVNGTARYGIDTRPEGLKFAAITHAPVFGGRTAGMDRAAAEALPGVLKVVDLGHAVAVVGETTWHAKRGLEALAPTFSEPAETTRWSTPQVFERLRAALDEKGHVFRDDGDVARALGGGTVLEAVYETPYLAHTCMEPMNTTALVRADGTADLWSPSQSPLLTVWGAEAGAGLSGKNVTTHVTLCGGGFGRRAEKDVPAEASAIAAAMPGVPIQLVWSREEDIRHDVYRPAAVARLRATLGSDGLPVALDIKLATQSVTRSFSSRNLPMVEGGPSDPLNAEGTHDTLYGIPKIRVEAATADEIPIPVGNWRSVGHSNTGFFVEGFMDELAAAAGRDPLDFRLALLSGDPRMTAVGERLRALSGWDARPREPGVGYGVALHTSFRTRVGEVARVRYTPETGLKVEQVWCVVDCGIAVNPDSVKAQMESGIVYALSALLFGEITIEQGRVVQSNFHDYDAVRLANCPDIQVEVMPSRELPGGAGEPGTPPLFAAVCNALVAAGGPRVRSLPLQARGIGLA